MEDKFVSFREFEKCINKKIDFQRWEAERKAKLFVIYSSIFVMSLVTIFVLPLIGFIPTVLGMICLLVYILALIYAISCPILLNKDYKSEFKKYCSSEVRNFFDFLGISKNGLNKQILKDSKMFSNFEDVEVDDGFAGFYRDVCYKVTEISLKDYSILKSNNKQEFTVFKGVVILFDSNKTIAADTIVAAKSDFNVLNKFNPGYYTLFSLMPAILAVGMVLYDIKGWSSNLVLVIFLLFLSFAFLITIALVTYFVNLNSIKNIGMKRVYLEDVKFDKKFKVYSTDQVESRYLLTTAFIDRYRNLQTAFKVKNIRCSIFKNKIMFVIPTEKDCFELASVYRPIGKELKVFYDQVKSIHDMIDYFKLNEKTGL